MMDHSDGRLAGCIAPALALLMLAGCAAMPPAGDSEAIAEYQQINDPLEPANRAVFQFNEAVDTMVVRPAAEAYRGIVPEFGRERVGDFLHNLRSPIILANDLLQGDVGRAGNTVGRFALNTTFGVLGIMDVAAPMGWPRHDEDFGQTLAVWGIEEGPYLVLPILGPSNPRDTVGMVVDHFIDPINHWADATDNESAVYTRAGVGAVDRRERLIDVLDETKRTSLDYYAAVRSLYRQRRAADIRNSNGVEGLPAPGLAGDVRPYDGTKLSRSE